MLLQKMIEVKNETPEHIYNYKHTHTDAHIFLPLVTHTWYIHYKLSILWYYPIYVKILQCRRYKKSNYGKRTGEIRVNQLTNKNKPANRTKKPTLFHFCLASHCFFSKHRLRSSFMSISKTLNPKASA